MELCKNGKSVRMNFRITKKTTGERVAEVLATIPIIDMDDENRWWELAVLAYLHSRQMPTHMDERSKYSAKPTADYHERHNFVTEELRKRNRAEREARARRQAEREAKRAQKLAEREAIKAQKRAEREAAKEQKRATTATTTSTTTPNHNPATPAPATTKLEQLELTLE